jgi:hypothetical protein
VSIDQLVAHVFLSIINLHAYAPPFTNRPLLGIQKCDLLIVLRTSLQVEPFNRFITRVPASCPLLLINREKAGEDMHLGFDFDGKWKYLVQRDSLFLGNCDEGVRQFAKRYGSEVKKKKNRIMLFFPAPRTSLFTYLFC